MSSKKKLYLYNLVCLQCVAAFKSKHRLAKFCSIACSNSARGTYRACVTCGTVIPPGHYGVRGLCRKCFDRSRPYRKRSGKHIDPRARDQRFRQAHPDVRRDGCHEYRTRKSGAFVQRVRTKTVFERDKGRCQICGKQVSFTDASLDHIVPLSRGGKHEYKNVQLSHRLCNYRRRASGPAQLRLV